MKIAIDCDDVAIDFKDQIFNYLKTAGYEITDLKYSTTHKCDYPEIAMNLAETIKDYIKANAIDMLVMVNTQSSFLENVLF